jgi:DNA-binding MarR family transcriptional regulator
MLKEAEIEEINHAQGRILFALWKRDEVPITELAKETLLHKSTLTKMLDRLERSGHIVRAPSAGDRRITVIKLTDKNRRLQEKYDKVSDDMGSIYYRGFSQSEIQQLDLLLSRVLDNLVTYAGQNQ